MINVGDWEAVICTVYELRNFVMIHTEGEIQDVYNRRPGESG